MKTVFLNHVRRQLALHELREGTGRPLLILHGLGQRSPATAPSATEGWTGPVLGLDFTGHGDSTLPSGGGYTCEALMSDADAAIAEIGPATLFGYGLGAYVGLRLFGSSPREVRGLVIADGPGFDGGGSRPTSSKLLHVPQDNALDRTPDPWALLELASDIRPPDYAADHVQQVEALAEMEKAVAVTSIGRPEWLEAAMRSDVVFESDIATALSIFCPL